MAGIARAQFISPRGPILWLSLCALLSCGIASTLLDLRHLPNTLSHIANEKGQRAVIDPVTGIVSLGTGDASGPDQEFDVGNAPAADAAKTKTAANDEPAKTENISAPALSGDLPKLRTAPLPSELKIPEGAADPLVFAPAPEISEKTDGLVLPKHGLGTASPVSIYARHFTHMPKEHLLALVITDAGVSAQSLPLLLDLPKNVTIAFSPYARNVADTIATLRRAGYESWAMLPVLTEHYPQDDPGPLGLLATQPREEILRRLHEVLAATIGSVGVVLPPDEALSKHTDTFTQVLNEIVARGLLLLSTHPTRSIEQVAHDKNMQTSIHRADMILDPVPDEAQIQAKLDGLADALQKNDTVIVVASSRPQTLLLLQRWFKQTPLAAPAALAPLSAFWTPEEPAAPKDAKKEDAKESEKKSEKKPDAKNAEKSEEKKEGAK